jgi:hypothetical protein
MYGELAKAETEVKQLEAAQKRLGAGGASDIAQKRMLDEQIAKAKGKVGAAWRLPVVQEFVHRAQTDTKLLRHANECWDVPVLV